VLTGDLDRLLAAQIGALPPSAITTAGTWQPAQPDSGLAPGTYGTPVAFRLAAGRPAARRNATGVPYVPGASPLSGWAGCQVPAVVIADGGRAPICAASSRSRSPVSTVAG